MKRLKKTLAVLLVLIMALSMIPFVSASEFEDDDDVNYKEAVDVLAGISVIDGFPDGTFDPQGGVTRAQAVAIVARLVLTRAKADALPDAPTGFPDCDGVSGVGFAIKYISYCVQNKIVVGYPNGKFGPNDPVKASEFAVMLMRALKVGNPDQYVGSGWQSSAILDAWDNGIFDGADGINFTEPANREQTALYAFNGLLVSPSGEATKDVWKKLYDNTITLPDGTVINMPVYGWVEEKVIAKDSIAKTKYETLKKDDEGFTDLGRPALTWEFGKPAKTIHSSVSTPVITYTTEVTQDTLAKLIGEDGSITATVNDPLKQKSATLTSLKGKDSPADADLYAVNGGRGVITEIYKTGSDDKISNYIAVVIKPGFAQVNVANTAATSKKGAFSTYTAKASDTVTTAQTGVIFTSHVDEDAESDSAVIVGTVAKDDYALVYHGKENLYFEEADTLTGVVTRATSSNDYTIDGSTVKRAAAYIKIKEDPIVSKDEQTFFVDAYGNILGVKEAAAAPLKLGLVIGYDTSSELKDNKIQTTYIAQVVNLDGVVTEIKTVEKNWRDETGKGKVCTYTTNATNGQSTFAVADNPKTADIDAKVNEFWLNDEVDSIEKGKTAISGNSLVTTVNNSTKFVVVNYSGSGEDRGTDGTVTVYTGRNAVPTFDELKHTVAVSYTPSEDLNHIADIVYIYDDVYEASESEYVFILGDYAWGDDGFEVDVIIKGETDVIVVSTEALARSLTAKAGILLDSVTVSSTGLLTIGDPVVADATKTIVNHGGLLSLDGGAYKVVTDDAKVYTITFPEGKPADATAVIDDADDLDSDLAKQNAKAYIVTNKDNEVTDIYIIVEEK